MIGFLINRFFFRIADFFHHWYVDGSRSFMAWMKYTENFPKRFGKIFGYPAHVLAAAILGIAYSVWLLMPIFIIYQIFYPIK